MASQDQGHDGIDLYDSNWWELPVSQDEDLFNGNDWLPSFLREDDANNYSSPSADPESSDQHTEILSPVTPSQDNDSPSVEQPEDATLSTDFLLEPDDYTLDPSLLAVPPKYNPAASVISMTPFWDLTDPINAGVEGEMDHGFLPGLAFSPAPGPFAPVQHQSMTRLPEQIATVPDTLPLIEQPTLPYEKCSLDHAGGAADSLGASSSPSLMGSGSTIPFSNDVSPTKALKATRGGCKQNTRPKEHRALSSRSNALTTDLAPRTEFKRDKSGNIVGSFSVSGLNIKVRRPFTQEARAATAMVRKRGVCEKCRRMKVRCEMPENPYEPCTRCSGLSHKVLRQPCIRVILPGLTLHRLGSTRDNDLYDWLSVKDKLNANLGALVRNNHTILLTQGFDVELEVSVAKFQPLPGDKTAYPWRDSSGGSRELELPHYYIVNMDEHQRVIDEYSQKSYLVYIQRLLKGKSPLMVWTMQEAIRFAFEHKSNLVQDSLRFWAGSRLTELPWTICGANTLGQIPVQELDCPRSGTIPIPPIMDTQMDHLVIKMVMDPLRQRILSNLQSKILEKRRENWYEIYLTTFVLMSNMERQFAQVLYLFDWYGMESRFGSRGNSSVSESFIHSCKVLLAHFHFACGGHKPLAIDWLSSGAPQGMMTKEQTEYLRATQEEIDLQGSQLTALKQKSIYETEMYWCHQLLLKDCKVNVQNDKEIDELKEADYIFH